MFHRNALGGVIAHVVTLLEQRLMFALDSRLGCHILGHPGRERRVDSDRHVACEPAWSLVVALGSHEVGIRGTRSGLLLSVSPGEGQNQAG
jgi:hypothetical protein